MDLTNWLPAGPAAPAAPRPSVPHRPLTERVVAVLRQLYVASDAIHRWRFGVYEFVQSPECIVRLSEERAGHVKQLRDGTAVRPGDPLLRLHYWNEHIPSVEEGLSMAWAARFGAACRFTLKALAAYVARTPELDDVRVLTGETSVLAEDDVRTMRAFFTRLGFEVEVHAARKWPERLAATLMNLHVYLLIWAVNPASVKGRSPRSVRRIVLWMSRDSLLRRYGTSAPA
jgi:hypothetical protein